MELEFKKEKVKNMKLNEAKQLACAGRFEVRYLIIQYHAVDDSIIMHVPNWELQEYEILPRN